MELLVGPETPTSTLNTRLNIVLPWRTVFTELPCGTSPSLMLPRFFERYFMARFNVDHLLRHPATLEASISLGLTTIHSHRPASAVHPVRSFS
jgi:hypothetical protein